MAARTSDARSVKELVTMVMDVVPSRAKGAVDPDVVPDVGIRNQAVKILRGAFGVVPTGELPDHDPVDFAELELLAPHLSEGAAWEVAENAPRAGTTPWQAAVASLHFTHGWDAERIAEDTGLEAVSVQSVLGAVRRLVRRLPAWNRDRAVAELGGATKKGREQAAMVLRAVYGWDLPEIAEAAGLSEEAAQEAFGRVLQDVMETPARTTAAGRALAGLVPRLTEDAAREAAAYTRETGVRALIFWHGHPVDAITKVIGTDRDDALFAASTTPVLQAAVKVVGTRVDAQPGGLQPIAAMLEGFDKVRDPGRRLEKAAAATAIERDIPGMYSDRESELSLVDVRNNTIALLHVLYTTQKVWLARVLDLHRNMVDNALDRNTIDFAKVEEDVPFLPEDQAEQIAKTAPPASGVLWPSAVRTLHFRYGWESQRIAEETGLEYASVRAALGAVRRAALNLPFWDEDVAAEALINGAVPDEGGEKPGERDQAVAVLHHVYGWDVERIGAEFTVRNPDAVIARFAPRRDLLEQVVPDLTFDDLLEGSRDEAIRVLSFRKGWDRERIAARLDASSWEITDALAPALRTATGLPDWDEEEAVERASAPGDVDRAAAILHHVYEWAVGADLAEESGLSEEFVRAMLGRLPGMDRQVVESMSPDLPEADALAAARYTRESGILALYFWHGWRIPVIAAALKVKQKDPLFAATLNPALRHALSFPDWDEEEALRRLLDIEQRLQTARARWFTLSQYMKSLGAKLKRGEFPGMEPMPNTEVARLAGLDPTTTSQWTTGSSNQRKREQRRLNSKKKRAG